ncbi:DUF4097 family beta strand repeat-containing protein [Ornithinimicrobium avium]|uniref:DUF4097 domain-containing protein n=1 Tax=Ornithinimicrobium avium TaxID=2283195 RepID=A0A345NP75_9MICO|nr:DUF4097 family beta strand repeat-containing protein [Ornithinimicrobium avium]AXH96833.1 hypothetical protein DV701_12535 [Ornithinimicrobium avium]
MTPATTTVPQDRVAPPPGPTSAPRYDPRHRGLRIGGAALVGLLGIGLAVSTVPEMVRDAEVQSFDLPAGTQELRIVGDVGDVDLRGVPEGGRTGISADKHWSFREPAARVESTGGITTVTMDCPEFAVGQCYADWDVAVPSHVTVVVRTSVGDVDADGLTGDLAVHSSVGDIAVTGSPAVLEVSTSVGDVSATLGAPADRVTLRTSVGDVALTLPGGVAYDLKAQGLDPADVRVETSPTSEHHVSVESDLGSVLVTGD